MNRVRVITLDGSLRRLDGGGRRVAAFISALEAEGHELDIVGVGPLGVESLERAVWSRSHRIKRRLLPVQFRRRIETQLAHLSKDALALSLIPSANRWALRCDRSWLDYPDLWSNVARNHARTVNRPTAYLNVAQAHLWARRETIEYSQADVVSVASWSDRVQLGDSAIWLPTPVVESRFELVRRRASSPTSEHRVFGFVANFGYPPNRDAYHRLVRDWLPMLKGTANRIIVAGFGSEHLPRVAEVEVIGPVDKLETFYDGVDVALAPIELGGGMKVKVVEAMIHGVPVVATDHCKDGLPPAVATECVSWNRFASGLRSGVGPVRLRDPRENPAVTTELARFTSENFRQVFKRFWHERMVADERK